MLSLYLQSYYSKINYTIQQEKNNHLYSFLIENMSLRFFSKSSNILIMKNAKLSSKNDSFKVTYI